MVAYDLNEPDIVSRLEKLGTAAEGDHRRRAAPRRGRTRPRPRPRHGCVASAGAANVKRQHMGNLQHNKTIVVDGPKVKTAVCGSTNFSWRGFFVQSNNADRSARRERGRSCSAPRSTATGRHDDAARLRRDRRPRAGRPRAGRHRRAGRVLAARRRRTRCSRPIADDIAHEHDVEPALLAGVPVPDARRRSWTRSRRSPSDDDIFVYGISDQQGRRPGPAEAERQRRAGLSRRR